jgi:hypothetical protein
MTIISMQPTPKPAGVAQERFRAHLATTPGRLQFSAAAVSLLAILTWGVVQWGLTSTAHIVQTVGKDSVPSIIAAEQIRSGLADMDANAANAYLGNGAQVEAAVKGYADDRKKVTDALVSAAQNITYVDEERPPIVAMTEGVQVYAAGVQTARVKGFPAGLPDLKSASTTLHETLLPAAEKLDKVNYDHLDAEYTGGRWRIEAAMVTLIVCGVALLGLLVGVQIDLNRRFHRMLSLPLLGASAVAVIFVGSACAALIHTGDSLKRAKTDAFDSVHALWKARAVANDANGDESFFLLESGNRAAQAQYEEAFFRKSKEIVDGPLTDAEVSAAAQSQIKFGGMLATELKNVTFEGEQQAALDTLKGYKGYRDIDTKIRALETAGRHREAIDLCIGTKQGESNWAFDQFDTSLGKTLDINKTQFDQEVESMFRALRLLPYLAPFATLAIILLAVAGLQPRLREYAF